MNIANNHAMDYGPEAQSETMNALRGANLDYDGLPGQIELVSAGGVKVAFDRHARPTRGRRACSTSPARQRSSARRRRRRTW